MSNSQINRASALTLLVLSIAISPAIRAENTNPNSSAPPAFNVRTVRMLDLPDGTHFNLRPGIRVGQMMGVTYFQNGRNFTRLTNEQMTRSFCHLEFARTSIQPRLVRPRRVTTSIVNPQSSNEADHHSTGIYEGATWVHFSDPSIPYLDCKIFVDEGPQDVLVGAMQAQLGNWIQLDSTTVEMVRSFELETPWSSAFAKP